MRQKLLLILIFFLSFSLTRAQSDPNGQPNPNIQLNPATNDPNEKPSREVPAKLFVQFVNALKPSSFTSAFASEKKPFLENASLAESPSGMTEDIVAITSYIQPSKFKKEFNLDELKAKSRSVTSYSQAGALLRQLESGLKPEAFSGVWQMQKANWMNDVNAIK